MEASRVGLCPACERKSRGLPAEVPKEYCGKHEWLGGMGPCPDCAEARRKDDEIASLKESLRDVLEISEIEGAVDLTVEQACKIMGARTLLGPESRFASNVPGKDAMCPGRWSGGAGGRLSCSKPSGHDGRHGVMIDGYSHEWEGGLEAAR